MLVVAVTLVVVIVIVVLAGDCSSTSGSSMKISYRAPHPPRWYHCHSIQVLSPPHDLESLDSGGDTSMPLRRLSKANGERDSEVILSNVPRLADSRQRLLRPLESEDAHLEPRPVRVCVLCICTCTCACICLFMYVRLCAYTFICAQVPCSVCTAPSCICNDCVIHIRTREQSLCVTSSNTARKTAGRPARSAATPRSVVPVVPPDVAATRSSTAVSSGVLRPRSSNAKSCSTG